MSGIANLGIPGVSSIAGGTGAGFGGIQAGLGSMKGLLGDGPLSGFLGGGSELTVQPGDTLNEIAAKNGTTVADIMKANPSITDPNMIQAGATLNMPGGGGNFNVGRAILGGEGRTPDFIKSGEDILKGQYTPGAGGPQQPGGSGGFGGMSDLLKLGGAGALAAGLGKLAFDEAKNAKGAPVTPYTTMDASGRYNIEAELARRMGQQAPNPVEFGLLPTDALPQLSGGQPRVVGAAEGGSMYPNKGLESLARVAPDVVERMGYNMGGYVMPMAYADGGDVAMEEFERKNGMINGAGTETSDDIPAMLSDGEFVMTGQAVRGAGSYNMNNDSGILTLTPNGAPGRESGTDLMYQLMEAFSGQTTPA
jgi:LysM repeat protein